ncbi:GspE/PulE family protein [Aliivibrio fischeri]|uniref:GspE/PulE family protein n=1 Tax=Aliivibrio fischeri TaxID=668 RepID=UPI00080EAEA4|nr:ATPase, T2SS/T4P/T4SS family [Aliivibrio fischeri]OCH45173.1 exonuclease SbcC [Aliivibrio fischeri]
MNQHNIVMTDELKSIYFKHQNTVLTDEAEIYTSDFSSLAIEAIKTLTDNTPDLLPDMLGRRLNVVLCEQNHINTVLEANQEELQPLALDDDKQSEVALRVRNLLQDAVNREASDVHIELYKAETRILARVDGQLLPMEKTIPEYGYGLSLFGYLFNELAVDKGGDFYPTKENNGRVILTLNCNGVRRDTIWRAAYIPAKDKGGQVTLRWLNKSEVIPSLDELGWETGHTQAMRAFCHSPAGICILTGQVGSGKTTAIAATLSELKGKGRSINTLEDPVEFDLGVIQTSIRADDDSEDGFFSASKALLRHDVDIESHGEIRDKKGAMSVCRKGETGQIMFTTMHTSSAMGIAHTLNEQMHVPKAVISAPNLMKLWVYQTLVRTLCPHCKLTHDELPSHYDKETLEKLNRWHSELEGEKAHIRYRHPKGCKHCTLGEKGRTALVEMIVLDNEDRQFIFNQDYLGWEKALINKGFKSVKEHALLKIRRGEIDILTTASRVNHLLVDTTANVYDTFFKGEE